MENAQEQIEMGEQKMRLDAARRSAIEPVKNEADKLDQKIKRAQGAMNSVVALILAFSKDLFDIVAEYVITKISLATAIIPGAGLLFAPAVNMSFQIAKAITGLFLAGILYLYLWRMELLPKSGRASRYIMLLFGLGVDNIPGIGDFFVNTINAIYAIINRWVEAQPKKAKLRKLRKTEAKIARKYAI
ncbi:hypothetical protein HYT00_03280 [Candidatus Giovannonibacteria bacterium]|nr:hypothetical protein [Candidatus Giovannonibacteria bacterium]